MKENKKYTVEDVKQKLETLISIGYSKGYSKGYNVENEKKQLETLMGLNYGKENTPEDVKEKLNELIDYSDANLMESSTTIPPIFSCNPEDIESIINSFKPSKEDLLKNKKTR